MNFHYDFDTSGYFQAVAVDLIRCHGQDALLLADQAIQNMRRSGDAEGAFLWEGVRSAIFDTIVDALDESTAPARGARNSGASPCH